MNKMNVISKLLVRGKKRGIALSAALLGALAAASPISVAQSPQTLLDAADIPQFAQPLPLLTIGGDGTDGIATFGGIGPVESTSVSSMRRCCLPARRV